MKNKKGFSIILSIVMVLTLGIPASYAETPALTSTGTASSGTFTDISGHWAEAIIKEASSLGIVGGYPDGTFLPDNLIKREEFYKLLSNILTTKPDTASTKIQFTDVVDYEWYVPTIKIAVAAGITSGYDDGTFGVGLMISRQEAAKVAGSVIPSAGVSDKARVETALDKSLIADWAYQYVNLMFKKGYMKGDSEGNFRPTMALTRAEAATILLNIKKNEPIIAANADQLATTDCMVAHQGHTGVFVKGSGTRNDPYEIATEEQLNHMRVHTTEGAFYVLSKNISITKDYVTLAPTIYGEPDWTKGNFQPIGSKEDPFIGSLFGNGYTISGLNISGSMGRGSNETAANYAGLFGYLESRSSVTDVIVDASNITGNQFTGAIAGYNEGTVKNCQLGERGYIIGKNDTGGIVGYSTKPLSSLKNRGTIKGTSSNTGGVVGSIEATETVLINCQNNGNINGNDNTGGIVGLLITNPEAKSLITKCYNNGSVQVGPYNGGGIVGTASSRNQSVIITECINTGSISGSGVNGGIAGVIESKTTIENSDNKGEVSGNGAGGIVGYNQGVISRGTNFGIVYANNVGGGIAAYQKEGEGRITKCSNQGKVKATTYAGGIVGENDLKVDNSFSSGEVDGSNSVGGIAGKNTGTVENVYSAGSITGEKYAGALIGRNSGILRNSFWIGTSISLSIGINENGGEQLLISKVTHEELSGQTKIKTSNGFEMIIDIMNYNNATHSNIINNTQPNPVWKYLYTIRAAGDSNSAVSDEGSIYANEMKGNTINLEELNTMYLYPSLIN